MADQPPPISRRTLIAGAAAAAGGALLTTLPGAAGSQQAAGGTRAPATPAPATPAMPVVPDDPTKLPGAPTTPVGARSPFVRPARTPTGEITGVSLTPLQDLTGTITPSDLHFERHHAGVPAIDPAKHTLIIHGMVDRPLEFTLDDLRRLPSVTRVYFVECSGNGRAAWRTPKAEMTPQLLEGMTSNSEWTGVPLSLLFREVGVKSGAKWFLAEGADAARLARSIPVSKGRDDALIAFAQNGEPLRPEQGYPIRLLLPGFEGNTNVKWLRRIELAAEPFMTRWETSKYTDPILGEKARIFSFDMDAKSVITSPSYPQRIPGPGWWPVSGVAWSGHGRISRVEVSTDGGRTWIPAQLQGTPLPRAHTRFQYPWQWDGKETLIMSRAVDDTGYVQPTLAQLRAARGPGTDYHYNPIRVWRIHPDGSVTYEVEG